MASEEPPIPTYIGSGAYCYADSTSMLLESIGESIEPRVVEVLSGVGLGAFWIDESQTLFLSGWNSPPDVGVSRAFELLGFEVTEEAESDGASVPIEALRRQLGEGPAVLGPLDMGELPYRPGARGASGVDHFVLAIDFIDEAVLVHDPAGFPTMPIEAEALGRAWRAELIGYRRGAYRRWHSPARVRSPAADETAAAAVRSFSSSYRQDRAASVPGFTIGPEAIEQLVSSIRRGDLPGGASDHLLRFALPLGVRRALDFSHYFRDHHPELAAIKDKQARVLGLAHASAVRGGWQAAADHLARLAGLEYDVEAALSKETA